jgi:hypothetical protein
MKDVKIIIEPLSKCLLYLQTGGNNVGALSRTILISCYILHQCSLLESIESALKVDLKQKLICCLTSIISSKTVEDTVLDIALEGLSQIWLKYPSLILEQLDVFKEVVSKLNNQKALQIETKCMILQTFTNFLQLYQSSSDLPSKVLSDSLLPLIPKV